MSILEKMKTGSRKVVAGAMSVVMAVGLMPLPAFAADLQTSAASLTPQMAVGDYIVVAAHAAANPAPEILGLSNASQRYASEGETTYAYFGDPAINSNPNPYLYNYVNKDTPAFISGWGESDRANQSPAAALPAYNTSDSDAYQN